MKRVFLVMVALLVSLGLFFSTAAAQAAPDPSKPDKGTEKSYLVIFKNPDQGNIKAQGKGKLKKKFKHLPAAAVVMTPAQAKELAGDPDILLVEPDGNVEIKGSYPWNISAIKADVAQSQSVTGQGTKVAVLDTGIDFNHEDLNVAGGVSFIDGTGYLDDNGHGTHVAGVIAALANEKGVTGVAPGASLYAVKVLDKDGLGSYSQVIAAIDWAIDNKINVVCMSFGGDQPSQALEQAMQKAYDNGILLVAAAGNSSSIQYPARFSSVIAVGAVDQNNHKASFSVTGPELELVAPGVEIESTLPGNSYGVKSGTSVAAPHVAGASALVWSARPGLSNTQVRDLLKQTAQPLGDVNEYGAGLVDTAAALGIEQPQVEYIAPEKAEFSKINAYLLEDPDKGRAIAVQYLFSTDPEVRSYAARVLGEFGQGDDLDYLCKVRENDSEERVRSQAALSIAKIEMRKLQDESGKLALLALQLNSTHPQVRDFAVYQLCLLNNSEETKTLAWDALAGETDPARVSVLQSVYQGTGSTSAVSSLTYRKVLDDGLVKMLYYNKIGDGQTVTAGQSARVSCQMDEAHSEVDITVYKNSSPGNIIASRTIYGTTAGQTISYTWYTSSSTAAGTYTIRFHCPDTGTSAYDVLFTIYVEADTPPPPTTKDQYEPNDSISQATSIQTGRSYTAYIETSTDKDYYRLVPSSSGTLTFSMTVPSNMDYDVDFLNSSGSRLTGSYNGTGSSEYFTCSVSGGNTYYIKIYGFGSYSSSPYSFNTYLEVRANDPYEPNNDRNSATPIQLGGSYTAYIDPAGDYDYYRFVPGFNGQLSFNMSVPSSVDYDVDLMDSYGNILAGGYRGTGDSESFTCNLDAGSTYYLKIYGCGSYSATQSYTFSTTLTPTRASLGLSISAPSQVNSGQTFTVSATVTNTSASVAATSVSAAINLPEGLRLSGGQSAISLGSINANSSKSVSWNVVAGSSYSTISRTITVTASASNADTVQQSKTVTVLKTAITGKDATETIGKSNCSQTERKGNYGDRKDCEVCPVDTSTGAYVLTTTPLTLNGAQPFEFTVYYNALLLQEGPMGKGWGNNFETYAETLSSGDIVIHWDANRKNTFVKNASSQYVPQDLAVRFDTLVQNADGSYTLTRKDQSVYLFNSVGKLTEQKNGHGQRLTMAYDASGRLTTITEPVSKKSLTLSYNATGLIDSVTDSANRKATFSYDGIHNLTGITDPAGNTTNYTYNADSRLLTIADTQGVRITNTYDEQGRVATQDDAVAGNQLAVFTYDETTTPGQVITTVTSRRGPVRVYTHDSQYQLLSIQNELGNTETYTYDADGNLNRVIDAASRTVSYTYDTRGNLLTVTDPAGHVTRMTYDDRDNVLSVENAGGKKITFSYDTNNNPLTITDPLGNTTSFSYDGNGLMTSQTTPGSGTTSYSYQNGLLHSVTNPESSTTTLSYDAAGRLTGVTDVAGKTISTTHDNADNLLTVADPLGNTNRFTYDSRGNRLTETDLMGNVTRFEYNGNNKLTSTVDALNNRTSYQYDGEDRLVKITNARGYSTTLTRDAKGRVTGVTDPLGKTTTFEYNAVDNLVGQNDSLGNRILTASYDTLNNPVTVTDALGNATTSQYDALNRITAVTDPLGRVTQFGYDGLNRLTSSTDAMGGRGSQSFDADGNTTGLTDPNGNRTSFTFDRAGRLTAKTNAWGSATSYQYNNRNLVSQITNGRGQTASLQYDAAGWLTSLSDPAGTVTYNYDANGNVLTVSDSAGTISRKYDALNRVTEYTDTKGNTIRYDYDAVGNLTALTYPGGKQVRYDYDAANRLTRVTDWAGRVTSYEYDANGRLTRTSRPNGTAETRSYDAAGQLIHQSDLNAAGNVIVQYDYTYDGAGNVTTEESAVPKLPFTLDNAAMTFTSGNRLATFNGQPVSYDADGNMTTGPLAGQMASYIFDTRNLLISAGNLSYQYDAENNRISVIDSVYNTQTSYIINPNTALSQVLIQTDAHGNQTFYVYGLGLIGQEVNGTFTTYHFDMRGSTVALTDNSGNATDRFQYAPYGEMVKHNGKTSIPFLLIGRFGVIADDNGLYYMRARYYNSDIRRFISLDPIVGSATDAQGLNHFAYVKGSPVLFIDPLGLWGYDVHYKKTFDIASEFFNNDEVAAIIAEWCLEIDTSTGASPVIPFPYAQSWHFDTNQNQQGETQNGPEENDSRYLHYREQLDYAVDLYKNGQINEAYIRLGMALHPLQDIDAHFKWQYVEAHEGIFTKWFRIHGTGDPLSPDWNKGAVENIPGLGEWSMGFYDVADKDYNYKTGEWEPGHNRLDWTVKKTYDAFNEFRKRACP